jgi:uncharacterized protein YjbI with pentapeptide repeats
MSTPAPAQELPKILDRLKDVRSEAAELRNFTITFLSLLLYINLIIVGTNAEQILRIAPVTLPLLNVPLPIIAFYGFVPWLLLLFHLYLLVQHYLFSQQLFLFKNTLADTSVTDEIRKHILKNLGNLPFLHWMIGKHGLAMRFVLTLITLVCLLIWPLLSLLWLQMAIMPYHSETLIWVQRFAVIFDVLLIGWLWPKTLADNDSSTAWWWRGMSGWWVALVFLPRCLLWLISRIPIAGLWSHVVSLLPPGFHSPLSSVITKTVLVLATILVLGLIIVRYDAWDYFVPLCLLWVICRITVLYIPVIPPASLWLTVKSTLPNVINTSTLPLGLGLFIALFLSLAVATLPDSWEERLLIGEVNSKPIEVDTLPFWLKLVDLEQYYRNGNGLGLYKPTRVAFSPTAWLHEQHAVILTDPQEFKNQRAKGAKPCASSDKSTKDAKPSKPEEDQCLMLQPWLPRNLILREKVLTTDPNLKPELEAKLQSGAENEAVTLSSSDTRSEHNKTLTDLLAQVRGMDLQSRNFDYADFTASSLPKVDLRYASLKHTVLRRTRLEQADLTSAHLEQINLSKASLTGATLDFANLTGATLDSAKLTGATLDSANLTGANLLGANLTGATLSSATLTGANLIFANLTGSILNSATLIGAILADVNLTGATLNSATLTGATLDGALLTGVDMYRATLTGTTLADAILTGTTLADANLTGAILLINTQTQSADELTKSGAQYQSALTTRVDYQNYPQELEEEVKKFKERIQHPADFLNEDMKTCVRADNDDAKKLLPACIAISNLNETSGKELATVWLNLACNDETEKQWLARNMVHRADDYSWFAQFILLRAEQNCAGLAWLSKDDKARLQELANKAKKPAQ